MPENYQQAAAAWSKRSVEYGMEIERLRSALIQIRAVCEDNPNMATNFIDEVARIALNPDRS